MSQPRDFEIADLFCGAGGTSTGASEAVHALGRAPRITAVNHWSVAVETHSANHPDARHYCASLDSLDPRKLYPRGGLDLLLASPECTNHSTARGGRPVNDQSRATAWCVLRWADALRPPGIIIENVPAFANWGPIGSTGRPLKGREGETFRAWLDAARSLGYRAEHRVLLAADYGDPQTRRRLFVQLVRGRREIVWPHPTHAPEGSSLFTGRRWATARDIIEWDNRGESVSRRSRPLATNTMARIREGLEKFGGREPFIVAMEHGGRVLPVSDPLPTVTTAKGGAFGLAQPFLVSYYGNGGATSVGEPLPTVTTRDRFALVVPTLTADGRGVVADVMFRMLTPAEYAKAQGFPASYRFVGTKVEVVKQIGNAVPRRLARAIVAAHVGQSPDVSWIVDGEQEARAAS